MSAPLKEHSSANLVGHIARYNMGGAIESQPTAEMRAELEAAGVAIPDADQLKKLATKINSWLEEFRELEGRGSVVTWFNRAPPPANALEHARVVPAHTSQHAQA